MNRLLAVVPKVGDLIPKIGDTVKDSDGKVFPEAVAVKNLPELTEQGVVTEFIKLVLTWSMAIALIAIVVAAIYYIMSRGKEEDITKSKDILFYLVIGMAILSTAFGIVSGIAQFDFVR